MATLGLEDSLAKVPLLRIHGFQSQPYYSQMKGAGSLTSLDFGFLILSIRLSHY